jgi:hypothetical protein
MEPGMARVQVINETTLDTDATPDEWTLWFQWCRYLYDNGEMDYGYRFIWRRPKSEGGSLQAARGQARIPSAEILIGLQIKADREGWYEFWSHIPDRVAGESGQARQIRIIIDHPDEVLAAGLIELFRAGPKGVAISDGIRLSARIPHFTTDAARFELSRGLRSGAIIIAARLALPIIATVAAAEIERWLHANGAQHSESIHIEDNRTIKYNDRGHVREIIERTIVDKMTKTP